MAHYLSLPTKAPSQHPEPNPTLKTFPDAVARSTTNHHFSEANRTAERLKALPSQGHAFLLNYMGHSRPHVAVQAAKCSITAYSDSEDDSDSSMEDIDIRIAREM